MLTLILKTPRITRALLCSWRLRFHMKPARVMLSRWCSDVSAHRCNKPLACPTLEAWPMLRCGDHAASVPNQPRT